MIMAAELEKQVLPLPLEARVSLVETLLESLPPIGADETDAEELAEVERRNREIESGNVRALSEAEFWECIRSHTAKG